LHSYDIPEIIALPVIDGLPEYLDWVKTATTVTGERTLLP
jgi:periplasmic divalent cation tolerance protein